MKYPTMKLTSRYANLPDRTRSGAARGWVLALITEDWK